MSDSAPDLMPGGPRSAGSIPQRRVPQAWQKDRRFRILSIDGGGIRGIFPAAILAGLERRYTGGRSIASCFDLVAGTSTGGILALGLGAGFTAAELLDLYVGRGCEVFPPFTASPLGRLKAWLQSKKHYARYLYDRAALERLLTDQLGDRLLGDSKLRLCIPAFEGKHSEVFVFKTPHHRDYKTDRFERMVNVGLATAAAPSYFRPLQHGGHTLVDGGVWANNPIMLAVIEALICFEIGRDQIDVLSLGCGDDRYVVSEPQITKGGLWHWKTIMGAAMRLQSHAATNQARLLLGPPAIVRVDPPTIEPAVQMDDWRRSVDELVPAADTLLQAKGDEIAATFLKQVAESFTPVPVPEPGASR
jgi:patatin-like phospholipase/acyl hydrolase